MINNTAAVSPKACIIALEIHAFRIMDSVKHKAEQVVVPVYLERQLALLREVDHKTSTECRDRGFA